MHLSKNTLILLASAVIVVGGGVYYFFFFNHDQGSAVATTAPTSDAELTFINLAGQLNPISFDASLLSDPRFTTLTDLRTTVVPEASGRKDPFAPIPGVSIDAAGNTP